MSGKFYVALALAGSLFVAGEQAAVAANITVVQQDLPVGRQVTVAGIKYQIMQFEVPAFDSDKIYLVKFPVQGDPASSTSFFNGFISVFGSYDAIQPFETNTINATTTGLSGFKAFYNEGMTYNAAYNRFGGQTTISGQLGLTNSVSLQLDAKTYVMLNLGNKTAEKTVNTSQHVPDTTTLLPANPTVMTKAQRNKFITDSRLLYRYVSVKEKI